MVDLRAPVYGQLTSRGFTRERAASVVTPPPRAENLFSADVMAAHDLQEAGVIGKAQRLRRPRDVPVVVLQGCDDDLALRLRLEGVECGRCGAPCSAGPRTRAFLDVGGDVLHTDRLAIRRDHHPLDDIPELSDVVTPPAATRRAVAR